jgi:predicted RNA-binding Zn-ribbon protein involved in translation (DUF1610 family)
MKMKWDKIPIPWLFMLVIILGFWVLFFSFWGVIFGEDWSYIFLASYAVLIVFSLFLIFIKYRKQKDVDTNVEEFEKTLKGSLSHFKCPKCNGVFALKKSKLNNKKYFKMTCPDCGQVAIISPKPKFIEQEIPEKKSANVEFKCANCGEGVTIWAEGSDLYPAVHVYSCPFCGMDKTMGRV